ncbi:hypothetical protein [Aeoliella sp.]|uniref:hypothetical protein n=1 Tax=Aeoliella sp. TaxID=2795800 RepID=UPI003CCBA051
MTVEEALKLVQRETLESDGAYTILRLGKNPGPERIAALQQSLMVLESGLKEKESLPRSVVEPCALILHFADQALQNAEETGLLEEIRMHVIWTKQAAFNLLTRATSSLPED